MPIGFSIGETQKNDPSRRGLLVILIQGRHVSMKNLFDATVANQVKTRLAKLEPQSERRWAR
jgi:hypothetical protein